MGHEVVDFGVMIRFIRNTAIRLATSVATGEGDRGILICGTGIGVKALLPTKFQELMQH